MKLFLLSFSIVLILSILTGCIEVNPDPKELQFNRCIEAVQGADYAQRKVILNGMLSCDELLS